MAAYRYFHEGQLKVDPTTGIKCRTGQLNHQFVEQKFVGGAWIGIGDNDGVRYGDVAGAGCQFREGMRDGDYAVDVETEVAGFLLAEGDGWVNCGSVSGYCKPLNLLAVTISDTQIDLSWTGSGTAGIERSEDGVNYTQIATGSLSYSNTSLTPNTLYYYRIIGSGSYISNVDSDTTLVTPVLDSYVGAAGAYGLRKLRTAYAGDCILVRRSSDDAELVIGFLNGVLEDTALLTFCGAGDGFVKTWYDQSGNANDATQATAATQPQIISGGDFILLDGLRMINFNASKYLTANGNASVFSGTDKPFSVFMALYNSTNSGTKSSWSVGNSGSATPYIDNNQATASAGQAKLAFRDDAAAVKSLFYPTANSVKSLVSLLDTGIYAYSYVDGLLKDNGDVDMGAMTLNLFTIGALIRTSVGNYFNGGLSEFILYGSDQSANKVEIDDNINNALGNPFYV